MSHNLGYTIGDGKLSNSEICSLAADEATEDMRYNGTDESGDFSPNRIKPEPNKIFKSVEDAREYLDYVADNGFYDSRAVKFHDLSELKPLKSETTLEDKIKKLTEDKNKYVRSHRAVRADLKSKFVTCKSCGSRINVAAFLEITEGRPMGRYNDNGGRDNCPVCGVNMRPQSVLDRIQSYNDRIDALSAKLSESRKSRADKAPVKWIAMWDYHCAM